MSPKAVKMVRDSRLSCANAWTIAALLLAFVPAIPLYGQAALAPGDWIQIETAQVPGLSGRYQIDEDGFIDFPVVGSLAVKGTTLQALRQKLQDALVRKGYQRPTELNVAAAPPRSAAVAAAVAEGPRPLQTGDVLTIEVAGEPTISGQYTVQPPGTIVVPMVGEVQVTGLTAQELTGVLSRRLGRYVVEPVVRVAVLSAIPRLVHIVGQVARPGLYPLTQTPTVLALLAGAGGVLPTGNLAEAVLFRDGKPQKLAPQGLLPGDILPQDVALQKGDSLVIPAWSAEAVLIVGAVRNPGVVPLDKASTVSHALLLAGGPTDAADPARAYILRGAERIDVSLEGVMGNAPDGSQSPAAQIPLQADDVLVVPPSTGQDPVYVVGAVNAPGPKLAKSAASLSEAIVVAGGVTEQADLNGTYILRKGQRFDVDLQALLEEGDGSADVALEPGNAVVVPTAVKQVYVAGQVAKPGAYPSEMAKTLLNLWSLVGSALPEANLRNCTILRGEEVISVDIEALINQGDMSQNVALEPGDEIIVPEILERVYLLGQVARPGPYPIKEGETLMDILGKAGGPTVLADIGRIALLRRNPPEAGGGARPTRPSSTREQAEVRDRSAREQPAFGMDKLREYRRRRAEPGPTPPQQEQLAAQISLKILATADWEDIAIRPQPGDVIYVPTIEVGLTRSDYERILIGIGTALLIGGSIW